MEYLLALVNTFFGLILFWGLLLFALLLLVAPKLAYRLLRRLLQAFALWLFLSFTLCQLGALWDAWPEASGGWGSFLLLGLVISGIAYLIYRVRHPRAKQPLELRGTERAALLPQHLNESPDQHSLDGNSERKHI